MRHSRNLKILGVEHIVGMDPTGARRDRFAEEIGSDVTADINGVLECGADLAVIASPNCFHIAQALACARAGCHLLIEKPLGTSLDGIPDLLSEVDNRQLFAHVGSNWKFHPAFQTMKTLIDDAAIGRIAGAQVLAGQWLPDWHPWEDYRQGYSARADLGGGVVLDSHELDYLSWLLGPVSHATGATAHSGLLEIDTEDVAAVCLRFESGALATLQLDYIQRDYRRRYHICGELGTIEWDMRSETVTCYRADSGKAEKIQTPMGDINDMYVAQLRHVLDGIADGLPPVTPVSAAARILEVQIALKAGNDA